MAKHPNIIPSKQLNVALPLPIFTRLSVELYSELEGRVPHGAYSRFLIDLLQQHFATRQLDLAPFASTPPGACIVKGSPETLAMLERALAA
jgi:hypothetical protein